MSRGAGRRVGSVLAVASLALLTTAFSVRPPGAEAATTAPATTDSVTTASDTAAPDTTASDTAAPDTAAPDTAATAVTATSTVAPAGTGGWTVYHGDAAGTGVAGSVGSVDTSARAWASRSLAGDLYGEPLVSGGQVYVATEGNYVYSLSASSGAVVWSTRLAPPVPASDLPCGDIQPTVGITGTPVIDQSRNELFVVADELVAGKSAHMLVGLDLSSGKTELVQDVDPPGASTAALLQRTGLTLDDGRVVFGFGGNYGDCASYRGRVVSVAETGGAPELFTVDAADGDSQGAIWMGGGAPAVDGAGNIWVEAGNGSVYSGSDPYDNSDSVLELSPSLHLEQYFAPADWPANNAADLDMSIEPVLLSDGQVLVAGKSRIAYLLDGARLGGIGGEEATLGKICSDDVDGGSATVGTTVYLPCVSGTIAVQVGSTPPSLRLLWSSGTGGGPPIVAGGLVWTMGQDGTLYGLDPATGSVRQQASVGTPANHFPTPGVGDGLLLATSADQVVAFTTSAQSAPTTTAPAPTTTAPVAHPASPATTGGGAIPPAGVAGIVVGGLAVIGGASWAWRRRRGGGAAAGS